MRTVKASPVTSGVITSPSDRGYQSECGEHVVSRVNVESLCRTPETTVMLYVKCPLTLKKKDKNTQYLERFWYQNNK